MTRRAIFDAIRAALKRPLTQVEVDAIDALLDRLGVARDDVPPVSGRRINAAGRALIREFEGCELTAYSDPVGVLTIGYGHTGPDVKRGTVITQAEADALLDADLGRFERAVEQMASPATDNQFAAMVSLAFNVGSGDGGFKTSTLRRKHNEGDYAGARAQFARWVYAGGKKLKGLERRRAAEAALYGRTS